VVVEMSGAAQAAKAALVGPPMALSSSPLSHSVPHNIIQ